LALGMRLGPTDGIVLGMRLGFSDGDLLGVDVVGFKVGLVVVGEGLGALVGIDVGHGPTTSQAYCHAPP